MFKKVFVSTYVYHPDCEICLPLLVQYLQLVWSSLSSLSNLLQSVASPAIYGNHHGLLPFLSLWRTLWQKKSFKNMLPLYLTLTAVNPQFSENSTVTIHRKWRGTETLIQTKEMVSSVFCCVLLPQGGFLVTKQSTALLSLEFGVLLAANRQSTSSSWGPWPDLSFSSFLDWQLLYSSFYGILSDEKTGL
jgi:hypothetical protein